VASPRGLFLALGLMKFSPWLTIPGAVLGSTFLMAATFVHYKQIVSTGTRGDFSAFLLGAFAVSVLASICNYFTVTRQERSLFASFTVGLVSFIVSACILWVALIQAFGE